MSALRDPTFSNCSPLLPSRSRNGPKDRVKQQGCAYRSSLSSTDTWLRNAWQRRIEHYASLGPVEPRKCPWSKRREGQQLKSFISTLIGGRFWEEHQKTAGTERLCGRVEDWWPNNQSVLKWCSGGAGGQRSSAESYWAPKVSWPLLSEFAGRVARLQHSFPVSAQSVLTTLEWIVRRVTLCCYHIERLFWLRRWLALTYDGEMTYESLHWMPM